MRTAAARLRLPGALLASAVALAVSLLTPPIPAAAGDNITLHVDGRVVPALTGATARAALAAAGITVSQHDEVTPELDAPLASGATVRVTRIQYRVETRETVLPYRTIVRPATRGNRPYHPTVTREGRSGLKRTVLRVRIVEGREAERRVVTEEVVREPVAEVVTARRPTALGSRGAYAGRRKMRVLASAYDPGPGSCPGTADGKTSNGKRAGYGIIAVDPRVIPFGTKIHVPGYGYGIAADVGGAIKGNRIDLGFNSRRGALKWGKKWVEIEIVD